MNKTCILSALLLGLFSARVLADVPPDGEALEYVGVFEGAAAGSPVSVALYDNGTAGAGTLLCGPVSATVVGTRFKALLPASCAKAIRENPAVFIQVSVSGIAVDRVRMRAQAYSLDAKRVVLSSDAGVRTTVDGVFCGATANTTGRIEASAPTIVGSRAGKRLCQQACGSSTAHMCKASEALQSFELGVTGPVPRGWVKTMAGSYFSLAADLAYADDCHGWSDGAQRTNNRLNLGGLYDSTAFSDPVVSNAGCDQSYPILCCD